MGPEKDEKSLGPREGLTATIQGSNEWLPKPAQGETFFPVHVTAVKTTNLAQCNLSQELEMDNGA
jgi:hypothetical protein